MKCALYLLNLNISYVMFNIFKKIKKQIYNYLKKSSKNVNINILEYQE
jgi:uncharacterized alkaline shock family protein YloU